MSVCNWRYEYVVSQVTDVSFEYLFAVVGVPIEYRLEHPAYDRIRNIFSICVDVPAWQVQVSSRPIGGVYHLCVTLPKQVSEEEFQDVLKFMHRDARCAKVRSLAKVRR